jgi:XRE family transcriptional regulator, regulator of sulfur utilization
VNELINSFGRAVRHFRELRGWSQELLAEKADLNRSYLGEVERGQVIPSLETAGKLAGALGISMSRLFFHCEQRAA